MLWQPRLLQPGPVRVPQENEVDEGTSQPVNPNVTGVCVDVSVEPLPDVAVHALVIPEVLPAGSHPWS
jgi:hypothetical protein